MLTDIISQAVADKETSDLVLKEGEPLWLRHGGKVIRAETQGMTRAAIVDLMRAVEVETGYPADKLEDALRKKGGAIDVAFQVGPTRLRGNLYYTNGRKLALALRRLANKAPALSTLGLPDAYITKLLPQTKGLILVTGATGSGKTTTLASTIEYFNQHLEGHIITLEDPIEYLLKSDSCLVDQRQIGRDADTFGLGLRAALREDPDIIFIGELRDEETIQVALAAAQTGHLVLGSLHTNSARQSVERITSEFGAERREWAHMVLSQSLIGCISQVLVPRADGNGRILAAELMVCTPDIRAAIREGKTSAIFNHMDTGSSQGQVLLNASLKGFVRNQTITAQDAINMSYDPGNLRKELGFAN